MMFLQYAIWGAWLPLFFAFLTEYRGLATGQAVMLFAIAAIGALVAPFFAGQLADRWMNTEKFLGISHLLGAALVWQLGSVEGYYALMVFGLTYSLIYAPTLSLTNSLAFHHIPDRDRDFGRVRVWGTIGWIVVGIGMGHWLLNRHTLDETTATADLLKNEVFADKSLPFVALSDGSEIRGVIVEQNENILILNKGTATEPEYHAWPRSKVKIKTIMDQLRPELAGSVKEAVDSVKSGTKTAAVAQTSLLAQNELTLLHVKGGETAIGQLTLLKLKDGTEVEGTLLYQSGTPQLIVLAPSQGTELLVYTAEQVQMQSTRLADGPPVIGKLDKDDPQQVSLKLNDGTTKEIARDDIRSQEKYGVFQADFVAKTIRQKQVVGMGDAFRLSAILGVVMGLFCFLLPATPPKKGEAPLAFMEAWTEIKKPKLITLFLIAFPVGCIHQFYFVYTASFLSTKKFPGGDLINKIMGVGGGGLMTIGQIAELAVLFMMPFVASKLSRKSLLTIGLLAYTLRFFIFAYVPTLWAVLPAIALHGLCFGCFFFVAYMIVDEETTSDVRASAQGLFNLIVVGLGIIVGNVFAAIVGEAATTDKVIDYTKLFSIPMWVAIGCLVALLLFYPSKRRGAAPSGRN